MSVTTWTTPFSKMTRAQAIELCYVLEEQRDDARAAIARVRALHVSVEQPESEHYYCEPEECDQAGVGGMETVCDVCERLYPCPTIRALDVRHDPSATTDGGAS